MLPSESAENPNQIGSRTDFPVLLSPLVSLPLWTTVSKAGGTKKIAVHR